MKTEPDSPAAVPAPQASRLTSSIGRTFMKRLILGTVVALSALTAAGAAEAKGCIKGAIVGGVAGHMAGHGVVGAAAGCAIGRHRANSKAKAADQQAMQPAGAR